jgi:class 3 adenylate cyclase
MRCSKCDSDNREGAKFCNACGTALDKRCAACGALNQPGAKFCDECGAVLTGDAATKAESVAQAAAPSAGERRHLTVLFCDLVDSTGIAAQLDPEEWRETVAAYHRAAAEAIRSCGGHVAKYLGDGVMAYFGWPMAHENDAQRAARAGLAILDAVSMLNRLSTHPKIAVRVGIHSGPVVIGPGAAEDNDVFGEAPNIAARVQAAAAPDTVLITAATHRLLSRLFLVEPSGAQQLKGIASSIELFRVVGPAGARSRVGSRALTRFVGREEETGLLLSRWERSREGEGQVVLVVGEAGIGKSRLVAEFHDRIRDTPHIWLESAGEQFFENTPFHAVTQMLSQWLELYAIANHEERVELLERALSSARLKLEDAAPPIAELLQMPVGERYPQLRLPPDEQRRRLLAALTGLLLGAAGTQPAVIVVEDLHWLDPSSLELHQLLAEQGATLPVMLLYTARPEFRVPWPMRAHHTQVTLNRLNARNVRELVAQIAARKALADETVNAVVERTSGVPLFVEELTRAVLESGATQAGVREIPATLQDSLMARLDRLGPAKEVAQVAAVLGSEFSYELLHAVHPLNEDDLQRALRSLADAELVYVRGLPPGATYQFKHALIRDAAYEALLKSRRKELHRLVAQTIAERFPVLNEAQPELLARHWTEAGETEAAIREWSRAAAAADSHNALDEALVSYRRALTLTLQLPESPERQRRELELRQSVAWILGMLRGFAAAETVEASEQAAATAEKAGNLAQLVRMIALRGAGAGSSGDWTACGRMADETLALALRERSPNSLSYGYGGHLVACHFLGRLADAEHDFEAGVAFFRASSSQEPQGWGVTILHVASRNAWMVGCADAARQRDGMMLAATNQDKPFDLVSAWFGAAYLRVYLRQFGEAEAFGARALSLAEKHQFQQLIAHAECILGYAQNRVGRVNEGIALMRLGISHLHEVRAIGDVSYFMTLLSAALADSGDAAEALDTIERALAAPSDAISSRRETLRIRGELLLHQGTLDGAERDFRDSIALAQQMGAKAWELRSTMSLARLLDRLGRRAEAHTMLAQIYNWFTEGLDTADLKDAKALLEELTT